MGEPALTPKLLLTAKQAAEALSISPRLLWELTHTGQLTPLRLPGRGKARAIRYSVSDLRRWVDAQRGQPKQ